MARKQENFTETPIYGVNVLSWVFESGLEHPLRHF